MPSNISSIKVITLQYLLYLYYKIFLSSITNKRGRALSDAKLLLTLPKRNFAKSVFALINSKAQLRQDLMVLLLLNFKRNGFFIEFGATNGFDLSNTYLLEKHYDWKGILAEPAKIWHNDLKKNRGCQIETDCVWSESNQVLTFNEVSVPEISTISIFNNVDEHSSDREKGRTYQINTISLNDLLKKYNAPNNIDFLSIDTEGSEFEILSSLNFSKYKITIICCEHNFTPMREQIKKLLEANGYKRIYDEISEMDDWYILTTQ
jgi:FkbM family methyltransferase